jgi:hypothetical protein
MALNCQVIGPCLLLRLVSSILLQECIVWYVLMLYFTKDALIYWCFMLFLLDSRHVGFFTLPR